MFVLLLNYSIINKYYMTNYHYTNCFDSDVNKLLAFFIAAKQQYQYMYIHM